MGHYPVVNEWIDVAIKEDCLTVLNIGNYTNIRTKKCPNHDTLSPNKMSSMLAKKNEIPAVKRKTYYQ